MKFLTIISILILSAASCGKSGKSDKTLKTLFEKYEGGEISECMHNGSKVYQGAMNAYDAGSEIYNSTGEQIGACYYNTNQVDAICKELDDCEVVYRGEGNIWGKPAVNKYGL